MQPCPICGSAQITIVISLQPRAFCSACGGRWIQDGGEQLAIRRFRRLPRMSPHGD